MNLRSLRITTYLAVFFLTLVVSLPSYTNSTFLSEKFGESSVGLIYSFGAIVTIISMLAIPKLIHLCDIRLTAVLISSLVIVGLVPLILSKSPLIFILVGFIAYYSFIQITRYTADLYLETVSDNNITGGIRGVFMTIINIAWLSSPLVASFILGPLENFSLLYLVAAITLIPFVLIMGKILPEMKLPRHTTSFQDIWYRLTNLKSSTDQGLRNVLAADFLLNLFYSLMVIYMPLLLHEKIGFNWPEIGLIFTVMLIPFVVIEYPLGKIADWWFGERELLALGFFIAGVATITLSFVTTQDLWLWAGLLFLTRVGAATIEIMKETALFKRIDSHDGPILALSRNMVPLSFIIGPILASALLLTGTYQTIFFVLGFLMLVGIYSSLKLKDIR